jgi:arylsulfatase A-like enzyme
MMNRREFLRKTARHSAALATTGLMASCSTVGQLTPSLHSKRRPNILLILTDQQNIDAIGAMGNPYLSTHHLDRLLQSGTAFTQSHSVCPVCSPARAALLTGRMPSENGVITNDRPIREDLPDFGIWLRTAGYETTWCGKWHLPEAWPTRLKGFDVLPAGPGEGALADPLIARQCEGYLRNHRDASQPFLLVASFMNPHDICFWALQAAQMIPTEKDLPADIDFFPPLPPNHKARPSAPALLAKHSGFAGFTEQQWRYYLQMYYRNCEMVDMQIGRVLDALEDNQLCDNTVVIFTSDHGEGAGRHGNIQKWYPYDEAVKVPFIVAWKDHLPAGKREDRLISGLDLFPTLCELAQVPPPEVQRGRSLLPLLQGEALNWRSFIVAETHVCGRMLRTERHKYVEYRGDPVRQLFDMQNDPWEMQNLATSAGREPLLAKLRDQLHGWEAHLACTQPTSSAVPIAPWIQELIDAQYR